jgi:hypothetical protein
MVFHHTTCEVCRQTLFHLDGLVAYQIRNQTIVPIELKGEQPWAGIRCVCRNCICNLAGWESRLLPAEPRT